MLAEKIHKYCKNYVVFHFCRIVIRSIVVANHLSMSGLIIFTPLCQNKFKMRHSNKKMRFCALNYDFKLRMVLFWLVWLVSVTVSVGLMNIVLCFVFWRKLQATIAINDKLSAKDGKDDFSDDLTLLGYKNLLICTSSTKMLDLKSYLSTNERLIILIMFIYVFVF